MNSAKKIMTYLSVAIVSTSLLAGYFCFTPQIAKAVNLMPEINGMNMQNCQGAVESGPVITSSANSGAIPPCCLKKNDNNSQSGAITLNNFSPDNTYTQSTSAVQIFNNNSAGFAVSLDYPISPTQTGISSSIALIE